MIRMSDGELWTRKAINQRLPRFLSAESLTPSAEGTVYVQASLRSNPEVSDTLEIRVLPEETEQPADKTQLSALISQAEVLEAEDYTAESYGVSSDSAETGRGCHGGSGSL